jgi:hypothetical protein
MNTAHSIQTEIPVEDAAIEERKMICRVNSTAIRAVFPFIAKDDVRSYLCGVNIRPLEDGSVMIAATDGCKFIIVRDPKGYTEKEMIVRVPKDAIRHADADVTFDVMNNGLVLWNEENSPVFIQPGNSIMGGIFPRIETVINPVGYIEGFKGAVNINHLADAISIKTGAKPPALRFFSRDEDSPMLFMASGIDEIEIIGGFTKIRDTNAVLPDWLPKNGEFALAPGVGN